MASRRANHEGSIYQRSSDGRWIGAIRMGRGPDGRHLRKYVTASTRSKVAIKLKALQRQVDDGLLPKDGHITLSTLFERWTEDVMRHHVEASTLRNYRSIARIHLLPVLGHREIVALNVDDVDRLLSLKRDSGLAPSTVRRIRIVLAQCLNQAIRWGLLVRNVAALSRPPKSLRTEGRTLSPDQARRFLSTLKGRRSEALFTLLLCTGLRRGEALGLMWTDFDRQAGVIRVARQLKREGRALLTTDTKTFRSRRAINLPHTMIATLLEHEENQVRERHRRGERWIDTGFIFTTSKGTPIDPRNFYREFRSICDEAGLGHWHPHELRHSAASLMLAQGVKLHVVSQVLGHSSIRMTSDVYGHLLEPDRQGAALAMETLLWDR
ncbi:MAG: site-specific integrase [Acidobacteriota bacterium]|nr:site-specific integrase [Acidobacteriota bacterium]